MELNEHLQQVLTVLRRVYPDGVPERDYIPLLVVLQDDMSERNLASVVAELIDGEIVVVENDAAAAMSQRRPGRSDVERVRKLLMDRGWKPESLE